MYTHPTLMHILTHMIETPEFYHLEQFIARYLEAGPRNPCLLIIPRFGIHVILFMLKKK